MTGVRKILTLNNIAGFAIFAVVAGFVFAITYPIYLSSIEASKNVKSQKNLEQIAVASVYFSLNHNDSLPDLHDVRTMQIMLSPYVKDQSIFVDPHNGKPYQPNPALSHASMDTLSLMSAVIAYDDEPNNPYNRTVALLEGRGARVELRTLNNSLNDKQETYVLGPLVGEWSSSGGGKVRFLKDGTYQASTSKGKAQWNADDVLHTPLAWLNGLVTWQTLDSFELSSPKGKVLFKRTRDGSKPKNS